MEFTSLLIGLIVVAMIFLVFALALSWLWNTTMPDVFSVNKISFWQALKLMLIVSILFGGSQVYDVTAPAMMQADTSVSSE